MHHHHHHNHQRRRKKRPNNNNYGTRTVDICRGLNGFGFTISGQQPCILSCIVPNSPADVAGLRAGNFLISVDNLNVSKLPHEDVVRLIGNSSGNIRMTIAENYYSDSSDDENIVLQQNYHRIRHKYPYYSKTSGKSGQQKNLSSLVGHSSATLGAYKHEEITIEEKLARSHNVIVSPNASNSKDISNVSAMVRLNNDMANCSSTSSSSSTNEHAIKGLEYCVVVGYLGTIEMPKQIATSSKLQTVRSCIRKMRQEKRNPTTVLMTILPKFLTLKNTKNIVIAKYPSSRLNYISSSSENDNKFFGLVTSQIYSDGGHVYDEINLDVALPNHRDDINISNSCHVFVLDLKLHDHGVHAEKMEIFKINCTKDPISNSCLEFPSNSDYIVNLIRSMYTLKSSVKFDIEHNNENVQMRQPKHLRNLNQHLNHPLANSPQPSEITTTSSNSDSGIGFHNDLSNISDRIVVVDFPRHNETGNKAGGSSHHHQFHHQQFGSPRRPHAIAHDIPPNLESIKNIRSKIPVPSTSRLTVRAMPDPRVELNSNDKACYDYSGQQINERAIDVPANYLFNHHIARSCDDIMIGYEPKKNNKKMSSIDDMTMIGDHENLRVQSSSNYNDDYLFAMPMNKPPQSKKPTSKAKLKKGVSTDFVSLSKKNDTGNKLLSYKLSPKVFGVARPISMSLENLLGHAGGSKCHSKFSLTSNSNLLENNEYETIWGSLQDLRSMENVTKPILNTMIEGIYSEPDLREHNVSRNCNTGGGVGSSPFRRWGQSSLRSRNSVDVRTPTARRPSSLAASENDVYIKSGSHQCSDGMESHQKSQDKLNDMLELNNGRVGPLTWSNSFEKLLNDSAGIHTFSEFLRKEFSAENIYFWTACERYSKLSIQSERAKEAVAIFTKHLATGAPEPVNVDSQARNISHENLQSADPNLFGAAQKQIFNLMKFDSYARFIRSDLYKQCLDSEEKGQILPYPGGDQMDNLLKTGLTTPIQTKLKKSLSNADDRRRKSLLPWHRKARCKSKDRGEECQQQLTKMNTGTVTTSTLGNNANVLKVAISGSDIHSSRSSLSSFDAAISSRSNPDSEENRSSLCRVLLSDGATTIVQTKPSETIRDLIERLLEKRGICYQAYETFFSGSNKPIEMDAPSTCLAGKEVQVEQRVIFKLDLPNRKVISVKSKPCKALGEVLRPILHKYNFKLDLVQVFFRETTEPLDMMLPVTVTDGQRLQVVCKPNDIQTEVALISTKTASLNQGNQIQKVQQMTIVKNAVGNNSSCTMAFNNPKNVNLCNKTTQTQQLLPHHHQSTLDEITNKVFNDLLQSKVESHLAPVELKTRSDQGSVKSDDWGSETSSGIFGRLRLNRAEQNFRLNKSKKSMAATATTGNGKSSNTSDEGKDAITSSGNINTKKPLIAKWKAGVKLQVSARSESHDLLEGLKRAQRSRLEDQRGTEINFELPDFLKDKENNINRNKFRKLKDNSSGASIQTSTAGFQHSTTESYSLTQTFSCNATTKTIDEVNLPVSNLDTLSIRPQPAPRLSLSSKNYANVNNNNSQKSVGRVDHPLDSLDVTVVQATPSSNIYNNITKIDLMNINSIDFHADQQLDNSNIINNSKINNTFLEECSNECVGELVDNVIGCENDATKSENNVMDDLQNCETDDDDENDLRHKAPPPLPPKPKILPIKPSNWGQSMISSSVGEIFKVPKEMPRRLIHNNPVDSNIQSTPHDQHNVYLDQTNSSFV